jgi:predicted MFS family arabinose efflux permease
MGGYLNQHVGWRTAFFVVGIPGIIFSILFYGSVKEPRRSATDLQATSANENHSLGKVIKRLFSTKTFPYLSMATALHVFCIYGIINWAPSFLQRLHGMTASETGATLGPIFGFGGALGSFAGGWVTDHFGKNNKEWYLKLPAIFVALSALFAAGAIFLPGKVWSITCLGCCASLQATYLGPSIAVAHSLVPALMRSLTSAILFLVLNFIGLGLGPLTVGMISDKLAPTLGSESLRWAMSITIIVGCASVILFYVAGKKLTADLKSKPD